jgi:signal transduction histidine kinase
LERKQFEEQRLQYLIELNRAKDEFISLASHQLRTPATGVKQYLGMVLEGFVGELTDSQQAILQKANESNERQLRIVSDLLKVAQVDAGKVRLRKTDVDVTSLIKDVIKEQRKTFETRRQKVLFEPDTDKLTLYFDRDTIRMVLENLIDNASKYSGEDKTVTIQLDEHPHEARITIIDNGVGIKQEDQDRLFEKFSRIDNPLSTQVGGTGLGLYWAKKIVDLHQGKVTFESTVGKGTSFTIHLPKIHSATMLESKV